MEDGDKELQGSKEDTFVWDSNTQLYFHASSGFYHDPIAGWYYSSIDGLFYIYENGKYVPMGLNGRQRSPNGETGMPDSSMDESQRTISSTHIENGSSVGEDENEVQHVMIDHGENSSGPARCSNDAEPIDSSRPSAWLEDMLIDLYLAGYNQQPDLANDVMMSCGADDQDNKELLGDNHDEELEEGEWIPEKDFDPCLSIEGEYDEACWKNEEIWQAQYGQVAESPGTALLKIPAVDLWDWKKVNEPSKDGNGQVARLVGRLVRQSVKLHPSVASGGTLLKTAPIYRTWLNLVQVKTGKVYKLRNPCAGYLASLSVYDSSNPTKDWGFPEIAKRKFKRKTRLTSCKDSTGATASTQHEGRGTDVQLGGDDGFVS